MQFISNYNKSSKVVSYLFLVVGVLSLVVGMYSIWHTRQSLMRYEQTTGTVVDNISSRASNNKGGYVYAPVVEFILKDGTKHEWASNVSTNKQYAIGKTVGIYYDQANPNQAYIDSFMFKYGLGAFLVFYGAVSTAIFSFKKSSSNSALDMAQKVQNDPELAQAFKTIAEKMGKE